MTTWAERAEAREDFERDNHVPIVITDNERAYLNTIEELRATIAQQAAQLEQAQTAIRTARQQLRATQENWREDCLYRADEILSKALGEEAQRTA